MTEQDVTQLLALRVRLGPTASSTNLASKAFADSKASARSTQAVSAPGETMRINFNSKQPTSPPRTASGAVILTKHPLVLLLAQLIQVTMSVNTMEMEDDALHDRMHSGPEYLSFGVPFGG